MTSTVNVTAHCAKEKEVKVYVNEDVHAVLQDGESTEVVVYDGRIVSVTEELKQAQNPATPE